MSRSSLDNKLDAILARRDELSALMAEGEGGDYAALGRELASLEPVVEQVMAYRKALADRDDARALLDEAGNDNEMRALAQEELQDLRTQLPDAERALALQLLPKDAADARPAMLEIRAGTGGDEAALFAGDLLRMYQRYADEQGWKMEIISASASEQGGYKEVIASVNGTGVFAKLKFESGVHRVQRVPATEAAGRIHTSAATVAVLPEVEDVDVEIRTEDLKIDTYRSSGAGGQYVNMTDSAVRITHLPTGVVATCQDERSQLKNRVKAMAYLRAKLYDLELQKQNDEVASERRGQIGSGDRSERIRTYNFPQNRISDHRIGMTLYKLDQYLDGDLYELVDAMTMADQSQKLHAIEAN